MRRRSDCGGETVHELAVDFRVALLRASLSIEKVQRLALDCPGGGVELVLADPRRAIAVAETARRFSRLALDMDRDLRILLAAPPPG
ncbi:MAG: hypothetical protein WD871_01715 [Xanthobacteraceae bacterium]